MLIETQPGVYEHAERFEVKGRYVQVFLAHRRWLLLDGLQAEQLAERLQRESLPLGQLETARMWAVAR